GPLLRRARHAGRAPGAARGRGAQAHRRAPRRRTPARAPERGRLGVEEHPAALLPGAVRRLGQPARDRPAHRPGARAARGRLAAGGGGRPRGGHPRPQLLLAPLPSPRRRRAEGVPLDAAPVAALTAPPAEDRPPTEPITAQPNE